MAFVLWIVIPLVLGLVLGGLYYWADSGDNDFAWLLGGAAVVLFIVAALAAATGAVRWGILTESTRDCNRYEQATGRETKLAGNGFADWQCYALVDGHWYPTDQVYSERPAA